MRGNEQLIAARAAITRQLELLRQSVAVRGGPPDNQGIIATLEKQLREIDEIVGDSNA